MSAWLDEAAAIGDALAAQAVWADDACNWLTRRVPHLMSVPTEPVAALETLGPSVYNGTAGVALALGRLARATGDAAHERAAQGALAHALAHAWDADATPLGKVGSDWRFGVYGGTLGVACVARELGRPEAARAILARLAESGEPPEHDIIFGSAGAILALLGMDDAPEALPLARRLGEGLLSWKPTLTGLSHGASGGALALAALHGATGEPRFREGALALFQWERDRFDAQEGNWPNYQAEPKGGRHPCATAWCHGAPGIGLARVQAWPHLRDPRLLDEARVALAATRRKLATDLADAGREAHPCHGTVGLVECAWAIAEGLGDADARGRAEAQMRLLVARHGREAVARWGEFAAWPSGAARGLHPPLMVGAAGVLHLLLRLHDARVPTALLPTPA